MTHFYFMVSSFLYHLKALPEMRRWYRCLHFNHFFRYRMHKTDMPCMQANTSIRIGTGKAILQISLDRTSHLCQLASYLMMSPSLQVYFQQKVIIRLTSTVVQDSLFTLRHFLIISITLILLLIAHQIVHQFSFRLLRGIFTIAQ